MGGHDGGSQVIGAWEIMVMGSPYRRSERSLEVHRSRWNRLRHQEDKTAGIVVSFVWKPPKIQNRVGTTMNPTP